jgi:hypothetical protein
MAALYVSSKMHDTLKKPRDLLMVSYAVRYPELAAKSKHGGEIEIDPAVRICVCTEYSDITDQHSFAFTASTRSHRCFYITRPDSRS